MTHLDSLEKISGAAPVGSFLVLLRLRLSVKSKGDT